MSFQLVVRSSDGVTYDGDDYARGEIITPATTILLHEALCLVGQSCDIFRTTSPGGQVPLDVALKETQEALLPTSVEFGTPQAERFVSPPTADPDAFILSVASDDVIQIFEGEDLDGVVGELELSTARNVTITTAGVTPADAGATALVEGTDANGEEISEVITVAQTATIAVGAKAFKKVTRVTFDAGGTAALYTVGFGVLLGISLTPKNRSGGINVLSEQVDGVNAATAGTFNLTNRTYSPSSAANATRTYDIVIET